jgi:hypothetical protein
VGVGVRGAARFKSWERVPSQRPLRCADAQVGCGAVGGVFPAFSSDQTTEPFPLPTPPPRALSSLCSAYLPSRSQGTVPHPPHSRPQPSGKPTPASRPAENPAFLSQACPLYTGTRPLYTGTRPLFSPLPHQARGPLRSLSRRAPPPGYPP